MVLIEAWCGVRLWDRAEAHSLDYTVRLFGNFQKLHFYGEAYFLSCVHMMLEFSRLKFQQRLGLSFMGKTVLYYCCFDLINVNIHNYCSLSTLNTSWCFDECLLKKQKLKVTLNLHSIRNDSEYQGKCQHFVHAFHKVKLVYNIDSYMEWHTFHKLDTMTLIYDLNISLCHESI